jgi:formylglycine-generating enzyme required for sulfatase activity
LIGNSDYQFSRKLINPVNDVDSMEAVLREVGFEVIKVKNADRRATLDALEAFTQRIESERYAVALVFFAGHGLQVDGINYLVPVEAKPERASDVEYDCVPADRLVKRMTEAGAATKILLLDACRNNPLPRSWGRSGDGGLAQMTAPEGTFIGFATAANQEALDGNDLGSNSPYTTAILQHLREPGLDIDQIFTKVTNTTGNLSMHYGRRQVPFKYSSLSKPFYFTAPKAKEMAMTLKLLVDSDCIVRIDGTERARLKARELGVFELAKGVHWLECESMTNSSMRFEKDIKVTQTVEELLRVTLGSTEPPPTTPESYTHPLLGRFIKIRGGSFNMGCTSEQYGCEPDEKPMHQVTLSDYFLGETEVTQAQWRAVMGSDAPNLAFPGCDQCPVERVNWDDVQEFIQKLNSHSTGTPYRLPTEAEWEYAARGGRKSKGYLYSGSKNVDDVAWHINNSGGKTQPVKGRKSNELGLFDMSGNVWEWCSDWYSLYSLDQQNNPTGPPTGERRVNRGGSWNYPTAAALVAFRDSDPPEHRGHGLGFRLARTP